MKRIVFLLLFLAIAARQNYAQPVVPFNGAPVLTRASRTPIGEIQLELVAIDPACVVTSGGTSSLTCPPITYTFAQFLILSKSSTDTNTWCMTNSMQGATPVALVQPSLVREFVTQVEPGTVIQSWEDQVDTVIQPAPTPSLIGSGITTQTTPQWSRTVCNGLPGVTFDPGSLGTNQTRTAVWVLAVY